jgi:hypothetical protein
MGGGLIYSHLLYPKNTCSEESPSVPWFSQPFSFYSNHLFLCFPTVPVTRPLWNPDSVYNTYSASTRFWGPIVCLYRRLQVGIFPHVKFNHLFPPYHILSEIPSAQSVYCMYFVQLNNDGKWSDFPSVLLHCYLLGRVYV